MTIFKCRRLTNDSWPMNTRAKLISDERSDHSIYAMKRRDWHGVSSTTTASAGRRDTRGVDLPQQLGTLWSWEVRAPPQQSLRELHSLAGGGVGARG